MPPSWGLADLLGGLLEGGTFPLGGGEEGEEAVLRWGEEEGE